MKLPVPVLLFAIDEGRTWEHWFLADDEPSLRAGWAVAQAEYGLFLYRDGVLEQNELTDFSARLELRMVAVFENVSVSEERVRVLSRETLARIDSLAKAYRWYDADVHVGFDALDAVVANCDLPFDRAIVLTEQVEAALQESKPVVSWRWWRRPDRQHTSLFVVDREEDFPERT